MTVLEKTNVELDKRTLVMIGMTNAGDISLDDLILDLKNKESRKVLTQAVFNGLHIQYVKELSDLGYEDLVKRFNFFNHFVARLIAYLVKGDKDLLKGYKFDRKYKSYNLLLSPAVMEYFNVGEVLCDFVTALDIEASYRSIHGEEFLK